MWKPIKGFENLYEVSDAGQVQSVNRIITDSSGHVYKHKGRILKPNKITNGYLVVYLRKNGKTFALYLHHLVAEAFVPNPENKPIVNHDDGDKNNCSATNLVWSTYSENNQHAYDTGLKPRGSGFYNAKLTEDQVREIRRNGKYDTFEAIASKYGVTKATIRDVLTNKTWRTII